MTPDLSIVIPYFNQPEELKNALEDVSAQTGIKWEAIVVDDFSDQPAEPVVRHFRERGLPVQLIRQPRRSYTLAGRLAGMAQAKGNALAFLDADDGFCTNDCLAKVVNIAKDRKCDLLHFQVMNREEDGSLTPRHQAGPFSKTDLAGKNIFHNWIKNDCSAHSVWNKLYSRSLYEKVINVTHDIKITRVEDLYLSAHFFLLADKYSSCNVPVYKYSPPAPTHMEKLAGRAMDAARMYVSLPEKFMKMGLDRTDALEFRRYLRKMLVLNLGPVFKFLERHNNTWELASFDPEMVQTLLKYGTLSEWCAALAILNAVNARKLRDIYKVFA